MRLLEDITNNIILGDNREVLKTFPDSCINTTITSPPYYNLRDYGVDGQIGLEDSLDDFIEQLCLVFDEVNRITKDDGTLWVNIGDCYANKNEITSDGRRGFSRTKGMGMADKTIDGLTHKDVIDGLSKDYEYRNKRDVWNVRVASYPGAHFATFPKELIIPCIKAGSPKGGLVLDPFMGSGTVAEAAQSYGRSYTGVELNPEYHKIIHNRTKQQELFA